MKQYWDKLPLLIGIAGIFALFSLVRHNFLLFFSVVHQLFAAIGLAFFLLRLSMTKGLPLIIEFGVFFDVLVAVIVLGILTWRLKLSFMTTDTSVLRKLKG